jgi:Putative zinc-finger
MNPTLTPPGSRDCEMVGELLSWYANGTLGAADRAVVDTHTELCSACRATLAIERRIVEAMRAPRDNVEQSPHAGWQKLAARLDAEAATEVFDDSPGRFPATDGASRRSARRRLNWSAALGAAVAVQAAAIAVLAVALVRHRQSEVAPLFHTLANADPTLAASGSLVRIAFDPSVDEATARSVAAQASGRILAGPSPENVYTFVFQEGPGAAGAVDGKVGWLRRRPHVLLVEPVVLGQQTRKR